MMNNEGKRGLEEKYWDLLREDRGIFSKITRKRLLGLARPYGGESNNTILNFWNRTRTSVLNGLRDLELFINYAEKKEFKKVLNIDTLTPVVDALLWHPIVINDHPDPERAKIAQLFIESGFAYLIRGKHEFLDLFQDDYMNAIKLSNLLLKLYGMEDLT